VGGEGRAGLGGCQSGLWDGLIDVHLNLFGFGCLALGQRQPEHAFVERGRDLAGVHPVREPERPFKSSVRPLDAMVAITVLFNFFLPGTFDGYQTVV